MEPVTADVAGALAKIVRRLKELRTAATKRCNVADENRAEQGVPLEEMDESGMRHRLASGQASGSANDNPDSPSTTSGESGTLTPGNDENPESQVSFVKTTWRRLSGGFGTVWMFWKSANEQKQIKKERGHDRFLREKIDEYPDGFSRLAAFVNSDDDFAMARSFGYCHTRVLLELQVEVTELEKALFALDKKDEANPAMKNRRRSTKHKENADTEYKELMSELKTKLKEYDETVQKFMFLKSLGPPLERNHRSYFNWIWRNKPLSKGYYDYIYHASDFVSLSGSRSNYFEELVRRHITWWRGSPIRKWIKTEEEMPTLDQSVSYYSPSRLRGVVQVLMVSTVMGILLIPVYLLFLVPMSHLMMAITSTAFIILFAIIMTVVAEGRIYEIFVGTATYAAILIMFLGNIAQASLGSRPN
ncbi:hypothetical protein F5882DRAFT_514544 [Hyaloscypha sp. PMI_1271]|nr:hypothetical protein F5882DRAFT_514544 [Hyaloscypha sp. PMI_1271]